MFVISGVITSVIFRLPNRWLNLESEKRHPNQLSSYAYATLASLYSWDGGHNWNSNYWSAVKKAIGKIKNESSATSWFQHTADTLFKNAYRMEILDEFIEFSDSEGLPVEFWASQISSLVSD